MKNQVRCKEEYKDDLKGQNSNWLSLDSLFLLISKLGKKNIWGLKPGAPKPRIHTDISFPNPK